MFIKCEVCGKEVKKRKPTQKCCSKPCYEIARQRRTDQKYIGQKFGMLTVLERDTSERTGYFCRCDCGNVTSVLAAHLISTGRDRTFSCGCHRAATGRAMAKENGIGKRLELEPGTVFGRLTIVEFARISNNGGTMYLCRCACGNEKVIRSQSLVSGAAKSCGCLHNEVAAENLRKGAYKHGQSNERAYLTWRQRLRYRDERQWTYAMEAALRNLQPACVICGSTDSPTVDHVYPFTLGGALAPGNVVVLCRSCNSWKHDHLLTDLPEETAAKITKAANEFLEHWNSLII